jgi:SAM-dependent methyltransferase
MIKEGKFDSDASALQQRIEAHGRYGSQDLDAWVFSHTRIEPGSIVLDLGCGTGKQTLAMAQATGESGKIVSVDVSQEALGVLRSSAESFGISSRISVICSSLDDLAPHLEKIDFDRVVGCYSLYYARSPAKLFETIRAVLKTDGVFFFCGPTKNNNLALKNFHWALKGEDAPPETDAAVFMEETGIELANRYFGSCEASHFINPLRFDSAQAMYEYWSSYNLYEQELDEAFRASAAKYFTSHPIFESVKSVLGVKVVKRRG